MMSPATHRAGAFLFRFAVIGDSHLDPPAGAAQAAASPSNHRFQACVRALAHGKPEFVVHLGDVVHPLPDLADYDAAIDTAQAITGQISCPIHHTPGNHDIGDKPHEQMPANIVRRDWIERFETRFGPQWHAFDHYGCRFVLFNSLLVNSGWPEEESQFVWLAETLADAPGRVFVATHYPPFLSTPDEPAYYDNIDEPGRSRLLSLLAGAGTEAVFTGHIHTWMHNRFAGGAEHYGVPSTAFNRRDFSEMFRVAPLAAFGREDPEKLGFLWVDVHEQGHVCRIDHTLAPARRGGPAAPHAQAGDYSGLGVDLRHVWCETVDLPCNPPVDPFQRKRVRNDYPMLALCELGLRDLRVPAADILDDDVAARLRILGDWGFRVTAFFAGAPDAALLRRLKNRPDNIDTLEVIGLPAECGRILERIGAATGPSGPRLQVTPLLPPGAGQPARQGRHIIDYGFDLDEDRIEAVLAPLASCGAELAAGVAIPLEALDTAVLARAAAFGAETGIGLSILSGWGGADKDDAPMDVDRLAREIERVAPLARDLDGIVPQAPRVFLDTFMDFDRSYHPRPGLIDQRANLTLAGRALLAAFHR